MYAFNYHKPKSLADAQALVAKFPDGKILAGGHTLIPTLKQRLAQPTDLIDIGSLAELKGITVSGSTVSIGAGTKHGEVAASADVKKAIPALAALAGLIGDRQVRNKGTIGGSLANNDPAADYPGAILGLGATIHTTKRAIKADDFLKGLFETALDEGEIITKVEFPVPKRAAYEKFRNPASRYVMVGAFVAETTSGIRVAITGAGPTAYRWADAEKALTAKFAAASVEKLVHTSSGLNADIHASAEYRAHLITVMTKRAVAGAGG